MSLKTQSIPAPNIGLTETACTVHSFATMLRQALGASAWRDLEPAIAARFSPYISENRSLIFRGRMQWVYCSPLGALVATVLRRCAILPQICARNTPFDFHITWHNGHIYKQRDYALGENKLFLFRSKFSDTPRLHEEFGGGLGMYLKLAVKQRALLFRDQGYFLRIRRWRLPIPRWFSVGSFDLLHRNIDQQRFQIIIRVAHPWFGTLFYQRGEFEKMEV